MQAPLFKPDGRMDLFVRSLDGRMGPFRSLTRAAFLLGLLTLLGSGTAQARTDVCGGVYNSNAAAQTACQATVGGPVTGCYPGPGNGGLGVCGPTGTGSWYTEQGGVPDPPRYVTYLFVTACPAGTTANPTTGKCETPSETQCQAGAPLSSYPPSVNGSAVCSCPAGTYPTKNSETGDTYGCTACSAGNQHLSPPFTGGPTCTNETDESCASGGANKIQSCSGTTDCLVKSQGLQCSLGCVYGNGETAVGAGAGGEPIPYLVRREPTGEACTGASNTNNTPYVVPGETCADGVCVPDEQNEADETVINDEEVPDPDLNDCVQFAPNSYICNGEDVPTPPAPDNGTPGQPSLPDIIIRKDPGSSVFDQTSADKVIKVFGPTKGAQSATNPQTGNPTTGARTRTGTGIGTPVTDGSGDGDGVSEEGECDPMTEFCGNDAFGGTSCSAPFTCDGDPVFCGQAQLQWEHKCLFEGTDDVEAQETALDAAIEESVPGEDDEPIDVSEAVELDESGYLGGGSCPSSVGVSLLGTSIELSYQPLCDLAGLIKPLLLAFATFIAAIIVFRGLSETAS